MTHQSMTGFGRAEGSFGHLSWACEVRCVNGRGLDVRIRLPSGYEALEPQIRKLAGQKLTRGNLQFSLNLDRGGSSAGIAINRDALKSVLEAINEIEADSITSPSTAAQILAIRGVVEPVDGGAGGDDTKALHTAVLATAEQALNALADHRSAEGAAIAEVLRNHLASILSLTQSAEKDAESQPAAIAARLRSQLSELLDTSAEFDEARIHSEAALLAVKADIREELDRLKAHCDAAETLLAQKGAIGRKLEFLAQEFNREANTLCSKSASTSLTAIGLDLKSAIDQFREQCLNLE